MSAELREATERQPKTGALLRMAMKVEGMARHASTHAAGVVISGEPLTHYVPLQAGTESTALTQYSMENLEAIGLLKMDFLGLRTLSILERALNSVKRQHGITVDFRFIPDVIKRLTRCLHGARRRGSSSSSLLASAACCAI